MAIEVDIDLLLLRWEDLRKRGQNLEATELCRDCPHLIDELAQRIDALRTNKISSLHDGDANIVTFRTQSQPGPPASIPNANSSRFKNLLPEYELVALLGRGGFGEVWKAVGSGGFSVALKFVQINEGEANAERDALDIIRTVRHPNLLATFGAWQREGYLIVAMELADMTLADRLKQATSQGLPGIPREELLEYMREAAKGVDYLNEPRHAFAGMEHRGIQHRDLKPQNILLVGTGVKVADFGLIRFLEHSVTGHTGGLTPRYAAPEFFKGQTAASSDQYSLAVTYCHLRGDRLPFEGDALTLMAGHVEGTPDLSMLPAEDRPAIARALSKNPRERWPNCRAMVEALAQCKTTPLPVTPRRLWTRIAAVAAVLLLVAPLVLTGLPALLQTESGGLPTDPNITATAAANDKPNTDIAAPAREIPADNDIVAAKKPPKPAAKIPAPVKPQPTPVPHAGSQLTNSIGMKLVFVPAGKFMMGSPPTEENRDDDEDQHEVQIVNGFHLGQFEVTQEEYEKVMGENPSEFKGARLPVEIVSWEDATRFSLKLSLREGKKYGLPTEAEWEYACRGGTQGPFSTGTNLTTDQANYNGHYPYAGNSNGVARAKTVTVGSFKANAFGLFDMHGNVWEWCQDLDDKEYYKISPRQDPTGPSEGHYRVARGGGWDGHARACRSADRHWSEPTYRDFSRGFRVALRSVQ